MKPQASSSTKRRAGGARRGPKPAVRSGSLETRVRKLENEVARFRKEFRASGVVLAAAELCALNERQSHEGLGRLRADLHTLRERGIVDAEGKRLAKDLPEEMLETDADVV